MISDAFDFLFTLEWFRGTARDQRKRDQLILNTYKISEIKLFLIRLIYFVYLIVFTLSSYLLVFLILRENFNLIEVGLSNYTIGTVALICAVVVVGVPVMLTVLFFKVINKLKIIKISTLST